MLHYPGKPITALSQIEWEEYLQSTRRPWYRSLLTARPEPDGEPGPWPSAESPDTLSLMQRLTAAAKRDESEMWSIATGFGFEVTTFGGPHGSKMVTLF